MFDRCIVGPFIHPDYDRRARERLKGERPHKFGGMARHHYTHSDPGILQASQFTLLDLNTVGILPSDTPFAYTYANRPTKAAYRGPSGASSSFPVARTGIVRTGTGRYTITLPKVPSGGVAHVSAVGRGTAWCQLRSLRRTGSPMQAQVACYGPGGTPKDSRFTFAWAK